MRACAAAQRDPARGCAQGARDTHRVVDLGQGQPEPVRVKLVTEPVRVTVSHPSLSESQPVTRARLTVSHCRVAASRRPRGGGTSARRGLSHGRVTPLAVSVTDGPRRTPAGPAHGEGGRGGEKPGLGASGRGPEARVGVAGVGDDKAAVQRDSLRRGTVEGREGRDTIRRRL